MWLGDFVWGGIAPLYSLEIGPNAGTITLQDKKQKNKTLR